MVEGDSKVLVDVLGLGEGGEHPEVVLDHLPGVLLLLHPQEQPPLGAQGVLLHIRVQLLALKYNSSR